MRKLVAIISSGVLALGFPAPASAAISAPSGIVFERQTPEDTPRTDASTIVTWNDQTEADTFSVAASAAGQSTVYGGSPNCADDTCSSTLSGLIGGVNYSVVVTAFSSVGGVASEAASSPVGHVPHSAPAAPNPGTVLAEATGISLSWTGLSLAEAGGVALTGYRITDGGNISLDVAGDVTETTISTGLLQGQTYTFKIQALNQYGKGTQANFTQVTSLAVPSAPAAPTAVLSGTSISANWTAPASDGLSAVTGYRVYLLKNGSDSGAPRQVSSSVNSVQFPDLANGTYTVQVAAVNAVGTSARSLASAAVTIGTSGGTIIGGGGGGFVPVPASPPRSGVQLANAAIIGGVPRDLTPVVTADAKKIELDLGETKIGFSGQEASSAGLKSAAGTPVAVSATALKPDSLAVVVLVKNTAQTSAGFKTVADEVISYEKELTVTSTGELEATFTPSATLAAGSYLLRLNGTTSSEEEFSVAINIEVTASTADLSFAVWTKKFGSSQGKMYAKNPGGAGKVVFKLNGKEIAWVRAVDGSDPKLRKVTEGPMAGVSYLVRTVKFAKGKNALEIYVDGERVWRAAYTLK